MSWSNLLCLKVSKANGNVRILKYMTVPIYKSFVRSLVVLKSRPAWMPGNDDAADTSWIMRRKFNNIKKSISKILSEITRFFKYVDFHFVIHISIFGLLSNMYYF